MRNEMKQYEGGLRVMLDRDLSISGESIIHGVEG